MIRPATPEDAAALTEIYNHSILTTTVTGFYVIFTERKTLLL